jgi:hypothetical protein
MRYRYIRTSFVAVCLSLGVISIASGQTTHPAAGSTTQPAGKEVLIPQRVTRVPEGNDYNDPNSEFCYQRSRSTANLVLFWAKEYGDDPAANPVENRRFNVDRVLTECERFYEYYMDTLKWLDKETSQAAKYKFLIYVIGGSGGTAFGGAIDNRVGALWTPATRINREPYGVIAHELGHSFQAILRADGHPGPGRGLHEMTSQYMLWQVYPEWMTFENYHLVDFMRQTHLAFLHADNQYHSCYPLEYWSNKHGVEFIGKLWREAQRGEDAVMAYQRITNINQEQFNDEMFDACRRFVTWDMPRIEKVAAQYANQHTTTIMAGDQGWYKIVPEKCPQNYGYNAIQLKVPAAGTKVSIEFEGIVGDEGYRSVQPEKAGWRYGFLASKDDGSRVYSETFSKSPGTAEFAVPEGTKFLWLVVMGAPTEHWIHVPARGSGRRGAASAPATNPNSNEQWPYQFKLSGTGPDEAIVR